MDTQFVEQERIFLSHKVVDKEAAGKVKQELEQNFGVKVFLSSDTTSIRGGSDWRKEIQDNVLASNRFVLLFSDPRLNWDWCLYEAGLFQGSHPTKENQDFVVFLPSGMPPAPLSHLQAIPADHGKIEPWLGTLPAKTGEIVDIAATAAKIADIVQRLAVQYFTSQNLMHISVPFVVNDESKSVCDVDNASVRFSNGGGALFQKGENEVFRWSELAEVFTACNFDVEGLWLSARNVRSDRAITQPPLDLFLAPGNKNGYRPVLIDAEVREGNKVALEFCLVRIPATFRTDASNAFDTLYQVIHLCCRFRWEVVEQSSSDIRRAMETNQVNRDLIGAIGRKIQSIYRDSENRRINETRVRDAMSAEARDTIDDILDKWKTTFDLFKKHAADGDISGVNDLLIVMRHLNHAYLAVAVSALHKLIAEADLPDTNDLGPEFSRLVPKQPAPWDYWRAASSEQMPDEMRSKRVPAS